VLDVLNLVEEIGTGIKQTILRVTLTHNVCALLKELTGKNKEIMSTEYLLQQQQEDIFKLTRDNYPGWEKLPEMQWLLPMVKEIWHSIIQFQSRLPPSQALIPLDLKFLIQMEQEGFSNSLDFYKVSRQRLMKEPTRIAEVKSLI
jgi:hypothetical protein